MELRDVLPGAMVPAAHRFPLLDRLPGDGIPQALRGWDAWAAVRPDEAVDAPVLAPADERYAEKLVALEPVDRASAEEPRRAWMRPILPGAKALCKLDAAPSGA